MNPVEAQAPGKLMLSGEYAVLCNAPAILVPVERRVFVRIRPLQHGPSRLQATPLIEGSLEFAPDHGAFWMNPVQAHQALGMSARLLPRLWAMLSLRKSVAWVEIQVDSSELFEQHAGSQIKLGIGSSAAVSVALYRALQALVGDRVSTRDPARDLSTLLPVYRASLEADASGADLAASLYGDLIAVTPNHHGLAAQPLSWPEGLFYQPVWTQEAAQTVDFVERFTQWRQSDRCAESLVTELSSRAAQVVVSFQHESPALILEALAGFAQTLRRMDDHIVSSTASQQRIVSPAHQQLARLADRHGVVYKSCGAGGGDLGVALSDQRQSMQAFVDSLGSIQARPIALTAQTGPYMQ